MAKRPKFSRWRRNPGTYRFGEQKAPDPNEELQRLTLYIPGSLFDLAEAQAVRLGFTSSQEYCTEIVLKAIEDEQIKDRVADVEIKHGPFEGLREVAGDAAFLNEFRQAGNPRIQGAIDPPRFAQPDSGIIWADSPGAMDLESPIVSLGSRGTIDKAIPTLSPSARVIIRHAAQGEHDPSAFLQSLRRGEAVPPAEVAELAQALHTLEIEFRASRSMDRRLAFALHRLAYESQILHTDAWPGAFDIWTVEMLRAVQEAVERILSGQEIRYQNSQGLDGQEPDSPSTPRRELPG